MQGGGTYRLKACDVLFNEHRVVKGKLAQFEPALWPGSPPDAYARALGSLVRVLEAELPPHFAKEEEALFPVMEAVAGPAFPPVEIMKEEHRFLIGHFAGVQDAAAALAAAPGAAEARARAQGHLVPLVATLQDHIVKEDDMLLVMASDQLEAAHDRKIMRVFDEIDREGRRWG